MFIFESRTALETNPHLRISKTSRSNSLEWKRNIRSVREFLLTFYFQLFFQTKIKKNSPPPETSSIFWWIEKTRQWISFFFLFLNNSNIVFATSVFLLFATSVFLHVLEFKEKYRSIGFLFKNELRIQAITSSIVLSCSSPLFLFLQQKYLPLVRAKRTVIQSLN